MKPKYTFNLKSALLTAAGILLAGGLAKKVLKKDSKAEKIPHIHYEMDSGPVVPYEEENRISYKPYEFEELQF